jgi:hypothetical protein
MLSCSAIHTPHSCRCIVLLLLPYHDSSALFELWVVNHFPQACCLIITISSRQLSTCAFPRSMLYMFLSCWRTLVIACRVSDAMDYRWEASGSCLSLLYGIIVKTFGSSILTCSNSCSVSRLYRVGSIRLVPSCRGQSCVVSSLPHLRAQGAK